MKVTHNQMIHTITRIFVLLVIIVLTCFNSCKKFEAEHELLISTDSVTAISSNFVSAIGTIVDLRGDGVQEHGFVYSINRNPTLTEDSVQLTLGQKNTTGRFEMGWSREIMASTTYYIKAYAKDAIGTAYGQELSLTTPGPELPQVSTTAISSITDSSAHSGGFEIMDGGASITAKGICWSLNQHPDVSGTHSNEGAGSDGFVSVMDSLLCNTTYYVRAYATNLAGTSYGEELSFTTGQCLTGLPIITTIAPSSITASSAQSGGNITDDGGADVTSRGVCWSTTTEPTLSDHYTTDGAGSGSFSSSITNLDPETIYFLRAYATNSEGTAYGDEIELTTIAPLNSVTDFDGNTYPIVTIGFQTWMAENLRVTHYSDGTSIPFVEDQGAWGGMGSTDKAYCIYNSNSLHGENYGALYSWAAAMNGATTSHLNPSDVQGVCPTGWHLPSDAEWKQMEMYLGMSQAEADHTGWRNAETGGKLKETGTTLWKTPNTGATNSSGFTARPGGFRNTDGVFIQLTIDGFFWTSTEASVTQPWFRSLHYENSGVYRDNYVWIGEGYSVRCVRDDVSTTTPALTTEPVVSITETSANSGGDITSDGGATITARGVCWSTSPHPTLSDSYTSEGTGTGIFTSTVTGLECNKTYYVRAYATNTVGTLYGAQQTFTTLQCSVAKPIVTTTSVESITGNSAESGGNVTDEGGAAVTARGVCWSTSPEPTLTDNYSVDGSGPGSFSSSITGLVTGTRYYVRAYATNAGGTAYGNQPSFYTPDLPVLSTTAISDITDVSATGGGNITDAGGAAITARGICWSITQNPTLSDSSTNDGTGPGSFVSVMSGLLPKTTYYVRSYATNVVGTEYGAERNFTTKGTTVTDFDGNIYETVVIGGQVWMAENLINAHYANGDPIPLVPDILDWTATEEGAYCYYNNDDVTYKDTYGALYNWIAASDTRNICPAGWHVPTNADWVILIDFCGGNAVAGAKLKEVGDTHWSNNGYATNEYGFTALPGGDRNQTGDYSSLTYNGKWWTSEVAEVFPVQRWYYQIDGSGLNITKLRWYPNAGYSVRCVKD